MSRLKDLNVGGAKAVLLLRGLALLIAGLKTAHASTTASLEEVVVPVIELMLKDSSISVKLVEEAVTVDVRNGAEITLFFNSPVHDVSVVLNGKSYPATPTSDQHYSVKLPDLKRAGEYQADIYAGDNLTGRVLIKAQGKSGNVNNAFDNLF